MTEETITQHLRTMVEEMLGGHIIALGEAVVSVEHPVLNERGELTDSGIRRLYLDVTYDRKAR